MRGQGRRPLKKKTFFMPAEKKGMIDYKDTEFISKFLTDRGKIVPRSVTGATARRQRELAGAIRKARAAGLLKITGRI